MKLIIILLLALGVLGSVVARTADLNARHPRPTKVPTTTQLARALAPLEEADIKARFWWWLTTTKTTTTTTTTVSAYMGPPSGPPKPYHALDLPPLEGFVQTPPVPAPGCRLNNPFTYGYSAFDSSLDINHDLLNKRELCAQRICGGYKPTTTSGCGIHFARSANGSGTWCSQQLGNPIRVDVAMWVCGSVPYPRPGAGFLPPGIPTGPQPYLWGPGNAYNVIVPPAIPKEKRLAEKVEIVARRPTVKTTTKASPISSPAPTPTTTYTGPVGGPPKPYQTLGLPPLAGFVEEAIPAPGCTSPRFQLIYQYTAANTNVDGSIDLLTARDACASWCFKEWPNSLPPRQGCGVHFAIHTNGSGTWCGSSLSRNVVGSSFICVAPVYHIVGPPFAMPPPYPPFSAVGPVIAYNRIMPLVPKGKRNAEELDHLARSPQSGATTQSPAGIELPLEANRCPLG